jgi:predicted metal-dependent HD superfamily phosphohydrolase
MTAFFDSWRRAWHALGSAVPGQELYARLMEKYSEPQRKYHTLQHLSECIAQLESVLGMAVHPGEVEIALWFHDAIYDVKGTQNEARSALWAIEALEQAGLSAEVSERVKNLVLATCHSTVPATDDERLLVDVDLAILGAEPARFEEYERQVRDEYSWVPHELFCSKRRELLQQFLGRPRIYSTAHFYNALEARARENIERSLRMRKA